jgi:exonuclease SbcC
MRPIHLEVEGFTCYRERQQPLDFSELSLFAIAGPTGAGKSSILDTMLYALYGQVPRLGKQGITEVISHGRDALSVCLDFEAQGVRYRVTRRVKRRGKGSPQTLATLADVTQGPEKPIADGVRPVNEAVLKVLGLGYDDFIQTVILPQGDFARFLRAEPKGQREILQHLLRHEVFERMRDAAEDRRRDMDARLHGLDGQLAMCADATEEALAAREAELAKAQTRLTTALSAKDTAEAEVQEVRRQRELTKEVEQLRQQRNALEAQAPEMERARTELENAWRAATILPRLEAFHDATRRAERAGRDADEAAKALEKAAAIRTAATEHLDVALAAAQECDELTSRVRRLDEIVGEVARRAALAATLHAIPQGLEATDADWRAALKTETSARKKAQAQEARLQALKAARDVMAFDEELFISLEAAREDIAHAKSLLRGRDASAFEADERGRLHADASREEENAKTTHRAARDRADAAAQALNTARAALEDGRNRNRAAALRAHLHVGDSCPVCLQTVALPPPVDAPPELAALDSACTGADRRAKEADRERHAAAQVLATSTERGIDAAKAAQTATSKATELAAEYVEALARLASAVSSADATIAGPALLVWMEQRRAELHGAKVDRDRYDVEMRKAEGELATAQLALASADAAATQASERHERVLQEQSRVQSELASVVARIEAVSTHPDPRAEREELDRRVAQLRDAEKKARGSLVQADLVVTTVDERLKAADMAVAEAGCHVTTTRDAVAQALAESGFASADSATAAVRNPAQQRALDAQVTKFDDKRAAVLQRLVELEPQIAGREVSAAVLGEAEGSCTAAIARWREADQSVTRLDGDSTRLRQEVRRRAQLLADRLALQTTLNITAELATDLKGDRFQEYLLEEAFKALVAGASVRMKAISNRYTLEWESGEFYVVDHDNAGERRRAETLSGGETFMASLCLALQLSDEVLRTSGALQIDSLFIDEGFGTLDSDSLSEVTDAIEALRQDGGRLIGVISHRPELTDRLPGCIRVNKGVGESRWTLERVG